MYQKIFLTLLGLLFVSSSASAVAIKVVNEKSKLYNEIDQSYDVKKSWWWYEEEAPEEQESDGEPVKPEEKQPKIKYKVSPVEDKQFKMMQKLIQVQEANLAELQKMNDTLDYNFPRRFEKYTTNKKTGKKCLSNSSKDCYVPILIPEAQQVPAMANFLKKPNMKNAKVYLGWQAAHFNHVTDVGYGLSFAYKQYGKEAYPTASLNTIHDPSGKMSSLRYGIKFATIKGLQDRLTLHIFLGKTSWMEKQIGYQKVAMMQNNILKYIDDFSYVHYDEDSVDRYELELGNLAPDVIETYRKGKSKIDKNMFKKFKIDLSPTVVVVYDDKKGTKIWQKMTNQMSTRDIISNIYNFLVYNKVIKPENITESTLMNLRTQSVANKGVLDGEAAGVQTKPDDLKSMVADDQYLSKPKSKKTK